MSRKVVVLWVVLLSTAAWCQKEGEPCHHTEQDMPGICTFLDKCPSASKELDAGKRPQDCGFRLGAKKPNVCCVTAEPTTKKPVELTASEASADVPSISTRMCRQYNERVLGKVTPRSSDHCVMPPAHIGPHIVGGSPAKLKEFPHMALLGYGNKENHTYNCGGTVISPNWILTAAHCFALGEQLVSWVRVAELDVKKTDDGAPHQVIEVAERVVHPCYKWNLKYNDILLLRLKDEVVFNGFVRPACLDTDVSVNGGLATAAGWGRQDYAGDVSDRLMKVDIDVQPLEVCGKTYTEVNDKWVLPRGVLPTQLCAGGTAFKDTCQGDSGGPLMFRGDDDCLYRIAGVTSFGRACGSTTPALYTRVASYVQWIENVVWGASWPNVTCPAADRRRRSLPRKRRSLVRKRRTLQECRDYLNVPKKNVGRVSKRMCREYVKHVCVEEESPVLLPDDQVETFLEDRCYTDAPLVFGGQAVKSGKAFPHMALLGNPQPQDENRPIAFTCGGTLIAPDVVLTAAHCGNLSWALLGSVRRTDTLSAHHSESVPQLIRVKTVIPHPDYVHEDKYHDIQLIKLEKPAEMTSYVRPACLHQGGKISGEMTAAGWGLIDDVSDEYYNDLMAVKLRAKPLSECEEVIDRSWAKDGLARGQICAGGDYGKDTCQGDSGGPLMKRMPFTEAYCMHEIVGVVSFGPPGCGQGQPSVYTRVSHYLSWIESITWPRG